MWIQFIPGDVTSRPQDVSSIASARALLISLIFCPVKSEFPLILLSFNFFNRQLYETQTLCKNVSTYRMNMNCGVGLRRCHITWQIPAMSLATYCVACVKLFYFSCEACSGPCVSCVACVRLETGLNWAGHLTDCGRMLAWLDLTFAASKAI